MIISDNKAAALNMGSSRVYLMRDGSLKPMTNDNAKLERLLKLGMITQEQVKLLSTHLSISSESKKGELLTSEAVDVRRGDVFLLCSDGLSDSVGDEKILEMLSLNEDSSFISNMLVKEALRNGGEDNITSLVVKLDEVAGDAATSGSSDVPEEKEEVAVPARRSRRPPDPDEPPNESFKTYIAAAVACVIIAGLLFLAYKVWLNSGSTDAYDDSTVPVTTTSTTATPVPDETPEDTGGDETPEPAPDETPVQSPAPGENSDGPSAQTDAPVKHTVQSGDSLQSISKKYYNDINKYTLIMESNNIDDPNLIKVGDVLIIP
jgi:LysM repeat protein